MGYDHGVCARGFSDGSAIARACLYIANHGSFGHLSERYDVPDLWNGSGASEDFLPHVAAFNSRAAKSSSICELKKGKGGSATRVVEKFNHRARNGSGSCILRCQGRVGCGRNAMEGVGSINGASMTSMLNANTFSQFVLSTVLTPTQ